MFFKYIKNDGFKNRVVVFFVNKSSTEILLN